jgi:hypothetical protein
MPWHVESWAFTLIQGEGTLNRHCEERSDVAISHAQSLLFSLFILREIKRDSISY